MTVGIQPFLLSMSFLLYALAKLQTDLTESVMQAMGMLFLCIAAFRRWQHPPRAIQLLLGLGVGLLCLGWAMTDGRLANFINSMFVLLSFPVVMAASSKIAEETLLRNVIVMIICFCLLGAVQGEIAVSYQGDMREARWTLGFERPTFLAEAMTLFIVAVAGFPRHGQKARFVKILLVLVALFIIVKTGSRAALGACVIFLFLLGQTKLPQTSRLLINLGALTILFIMAILLDGDGFDPDSINEFTSGRLAILLMEVGGNITQPIHWLLGNGAAKTVFEYSTERTGLVYHFDSFFGERLVVAGILGAMVVILIIMFYARECAPQGRAVIAACVFYGVFENGVFNITSLFSTFMLLFAVTALRTPQGSLRAAAHSGAATRPASANWAGHRVGDLKRLET